MKKRVLSVLVAVMLVASMFTSAMAAAVTLEATPAAVEPGEEFTVTLTAPAVAGAKAATIQTKINYDPTAAELIKYVAPELKGGNTMQSTVEEAKANGAYTSTITSATGENTITLENDIVWTATFKLLEGAAEAAFEVETFYIQGLADDGYSPIDYYTEADVPAEGIVTVKADLPCAHQWVEKEGKDATCTEAGYTAYKECALCEAVEGQEVIEALGHDKVYGEWTEWAHNGKVAEGEECKECTMTRTRTVTCSRCDWTDVETESKKHNDNPATGDTMMAVLFLGMAAMFVSGMVVVNKARKNA